MTMLTRPRLEAKKCANAARWLRTIWGQRKQLPQLPGHFYSPVYSPTDVERFREQRAALIANQDLPGIDLHVADQLALLAELDQYHDQSYFTGPTQTSHRYRFENDYFTWGDAVFYRALIAHIRPGLIVEIGSGHSTALALDALTDFGIDAAMTLIEPHPERLESVLSAEDLARFTLHRSDAQTVDLKVFDDLRSGDILFVDSSHVTRLGSDVNRIVFDVLGRLPAGVWIHFHDICYPFEYPLEWVEGFRAWNEAYLLRAFLEFNPSFSIALWVNYLTVHHPEELRQRFDPALAHRDGGGSMWLRKVR